MNNPIFNALGGAMPNLGNMGQLLQQFQQFKNTFKGDPRQQIQQMLNSGQITQERYNQAVQLAQQLQGLLK